MDRQQLKQFQTALLRAFPTRAALAQMVRFGLDESLAVLAGDGGTLAETVFALLEWAEAHGKLDTLLAAAREANPGNPELRAFAASLAPAPAGPPTDPADAPRPTAPPLDAPRPTAPPAAGSPPLPPPGADPAGRAPPGARAVEGRAAVVIGINYLDFPAGTPGEVATKGRATALRYAEADARDMAACVGAAGYDVVLLLGAAATRGAIIRALRRQVQKAGPQGFLLVHFSGHGQIDPDDPGTAYLLPVDADPETPADLAIPLTDLAGRFLGSVRSALTLLDCCHSGYAVGLKAVGVPDELGAEFGRAAQATFRNVRGRFHITACAGNQLARELPDLEHGAFTYYALEWWRQGLDVDSLSLAGHIAAALPQRGLPAPAYGGALEGRQLLRDARPVLAPPPPAPAPAPSAGPPADPAWRAQIRPQLARLEESRVRDLCFLRLGVDYDGLSGTDAAAKTRRLIALMDVADRRDALTAAVMDALAQQRSARVLAARIAANLDSTAIARLWQTLDLADTLPAVAASPTSVPELVAWAEETGQFTDLETAVATAVARQASAQVEPEQAAPQTEAHLEQEESEHQTPTPGAHEEADRQGAQQEARRPAWEKIPPAAPVPRVTLRGHTARVYSAAWSPDGRAVVTASAEGTAKVWDVVTGQERFTLRADSNWVASAAWRPDGGALVTAGGDGLAKIWQAATGQERLTFQADTSWVASAAWRPDGGALVTAGGDGLAKVWDVATGQERVTLRGHTGPVRSAAWSPDGQAIVTASDDKTVKIWQAATGQGLLTLRGHTGPVRSVAWSPAGRAIASGADDGMVKIWDAILGHERATFSGHAPGVSSVAWSSDGRAIVTTGGDQTARVWDAATGQERATLRGHTNWVNSAMWSPDGSAIVTASSDGTAIIWDAPELP